MFTLIKLVFIVLLNFSSSLATKCLYLNNEPCMVRPTLIDLNLVEFKCYPFIVSPDKCSESCNSANDLSTKICFPIKIKDINVKSFNMITNRDEAKTLVKHISCDFKCKFNSTTCNLNQKWNNKACQCVCKNYSTSKKDYSCNPSTCICENSKFLKIMIMKNSDTSVIACHEIIHGMDIVSTKMTNTIATIVSKIYHNKKVRYKIDCYILHTVLLVVILLLIITIISYHYVKHSPKEKGIDALTIQKGN